MSSQGRMSKFSKIFSPALLGMKKYITWRMLLKSVASSALLVHGIWKGNMAVEGNLMISLIKTKGFLVRQCMRVDDKILGCFCFSLSWWWQFQFITPLLFSILLIHIELDYTCGVINWIQLDTFLFVFVMNTQNGIKMAAWPKIIYSDNTK